MPVSRIFIVPFVFAFALLSAAPSASAGSAETATHQTVREPVEWILPADQCPSLPAGVQVSGRGQRHAVTTTIERADGSMTLITNDFVKGTAVDSNDRSYRFVYRNHTTETRPPSGSDLPVQVEMTDTFVLHRPDGAVTVDVGFNWRWTYAPDDPQWPPDDVSLEKLSTRGDPLACDPI